MSKPVKEFVDLIEIRHDIFIQRICHIVESHLFSRIERAVSPNNGTGWNSIADRVEARIDPRRDFLSRTQ